MRDENQLYTPEEYFVIDEADEWKNEFYQGKIRPCAHDSATHSLIITNTMVALHTELRSKPCRVFASRMRLHVAQNGLYAFPDILVICGKVEFALGRNDTITNPVLIVEVFSPSTHYYDRVKKFALYKPLESLREYLLVDSERVHATLLRLANGVWTIEMYDDLDATFHLESVDGDLALRDLYDKIEMDTLTPE